MLHSTLDATFGSGGKVTTDFEGPYDGASSVAIQADGKIVAAGTIVNSSSSARLHASAAHGTLPDGVAQVLKVSDAMSFNTFSRLNSLTKRFNFAFSCSNSFNRFA